MNPYNPKTTINFQDIVSYFLSGYILFSILTYHLDWIEIGLFTLALIIARWLTILRK